MQKRFFSSLALSLFLNLLIKPVSVLFIDAGVQRVLGNEEYGNYFVLLSLTLVFNIFLDLGINNYTTRFIAQNNSLINEHVRKTIPLRILLFLSYVVLVFITAFLIGIEFSCAGILLILILNQFLIQSIALVRSLLSGLHLFKTDAVLSVMDRALLILFMGGILIFDRQSVTIMSFVLCQFLGYFISFLFSLYYIRRQIHGHLFQLDFTYIRDVLRKSFPFALLVLLMLVYNRFDVVLLKKIALNGAFQAEIYAQGFRLLDAFYMLGMIFAGLLYPLFSKMLIENKNDLHSVVHITAKLLIGGAFGVLIIAFFNGDFLLSLIYGDKVNQASIQAFIWLMGAFTAMSFNFIFGTLLTTAGEMRIMNAVALTGVIISVSANVLMIPYFGAVGSAMVALFTQTIVSTLLVLYVKIKLGVFLDKKSIIYLLGYLLTLILFKLLTRGQFSATTTILVDLIAILIVALVFSIIDLKSLKKIWALNDLHQ